MNLEEMMFQDEEKVYEHIKSKPLHALSNREIDVLVERYVMKKRPSVNIHSKLPTSDNFPPHYSSDESDAFLVVNILRKEEEYWFELGTDKSFSLDYACYLQLDEQEHRAVAKTAPMAICLAALKSVGIEKE